MISGATVDVVAAFDEHTFRAPPLFSFSLINTAKEMWRAKIYPLFILVVVFSGIWPYVKLILLLLAWVTPKPTLSARHRGKLLLALDALSKFSLVDTYVLVLMVVAFRYRLDLGRESNLNVYITPKFGFFGFLVSTVMSLVCGHIMVFSHRRAELHVAEMEATPNEPLLQHSFYVEGERKQLSKRFQVVLLCMLLTICVLLGIGITCKSFIFEFDGLAGMVIGEQSRSAYSLLTLGTSISDSVENPTSLGVFFLQLSYYFYALVMPWTCLASLALLLLLPMTVQRQLIILTIAEIANAWSAVEVFVLSVLAALLEISTFASFILGHRCDLIDNILADHEAEWFGPHHRPTCYTVTSIVSRDSAFLIMGVLLNSAWVSLVLRLAHLAMEERIKELSHGLVEDHLSLHEVASLSLVERLGTWSWTSWMLTAYSMNVSFQLPSQHDQEETMGPPIFAGDEGAGTAAPASLPWQSPQNRRVFEDEWKESAEKDPAWKEWKEATNVT